MKSSNAQTVKNPWFENFLEMDDLCLVLHFPIVREREQKRERHWKVQKKSENLARSVETQQKILKKEAKKKKNDWKSEQCEKKKQTKKAKK